MVEALLPMPWPGGRAADAIPSSLCPPPPPASNLPFPHQNTCTSSFTQSHSLNRHQIAFSDPTLLPASPPSFRIAPPPPLFAFPCWIIRGPLGFRHRAPRTRGPFGPRAFRGRGPCGCMGTRVSLAQGAARPPPCHRRAAAAIAARPALRCSLTRKALPVPDEHRVPARFAARGFK
jgi:hypothetical protein